MLCLRTTSHLRNMKRLLTRERSSCCASTKRCMSSAQPHSPLPAGSEIAPPPLAPPPLAPPPLSSPSSVSASEKISAAESTTRVADHYFAGASSSSEMTVFKRAFKQYKQRQPRPDLSRVLDVRAVDGRRRGGGEGGVDIRPIELPSSFPFSPSEVLSLGLRPVSEWRVATLAGRDGLYIIPDVLREEAHLVWLDRMFRYAEPPHTTNLTAHGTSPHTDVLASAGRSLRWTTLGVEYNWETKEYPMEGRPLPEELGKLGEVVAASLGLSMRPDAAIVNYYPPKATLSPHVDRSERDLSVPLVSVSLGQSAVYLTGGTSLDDEVIPVWLRSGDVLVMHADQRLVYHAVPRVERTRDFRGEGEGGKGDWPAPLVEYANTSRVNVTIRQVN